MRVWGPGSRRPGPLAGPFAPFAPRGDGAELRLVLCSQHPHARLRSLGTLPGTHFANSSRFTRGLLGEQETHVCSRPHQARLHPARPAGVRTRSREQGGGAASGRTGTWDGRGPRLRLAGKSWGPALLPREETRVSPLAENGAKSLGAPFRSLL